MNTKPTVDVVIPALNEERMIAQCVEAVTQQDYPKELLSVYVAVDQRTTDSTARVAREAGAIVIEAGCSGAACVRNAGTAAGRGELVGFLDGHCIVEPGWLKAMVARFVDDAIGGCQGSFTVGYDSEVVQRFASVTLFGSEQRLRNQTVDGRTTPYPWLLGGNCMFRRASLDETGGFKNCLSEDTDCSWSIFLRGYQFAYAPDARASHVNSDTLARFLFKHYRHGRAAAQLAYAYGFSGRRDTDKTSEPVKFILDLFYNSGYAVERLRQALGDIVLPLHNYEPVCSKFRAPFTWTSNVQLQISPRVVYWHIDNRETIAIELTRRTRVLFEGSSDVIFRRLAIGANRITVCSALAKFYDIDFATAGQDVDGFIQELLESKIIQSFTSSCDGSTKARSDSAPVSS